jgi:hypothetical protein
LFIPAQVLSATEGKVVLWHSDLELDHAPSAGTVRLEGDGQYLRLRLAGGELTAGGCRFEEFIGRFAGMATADAATASVHPRPIATRDQALLAP